MHYRTITETGVPVQPTASQKLAAQHRVGYRKALEDGKAARTPLALSTAQGWMDHHAKLVRKLEGKA